EIGFELGFLKNRIYLTSALFDAKTNNQTIPITISSTTGYTRAFVNSGEMQNRGVEVDLRFSPVVNTKNGFRWDLGFNFSYIDNKLLSIASDLDKVFVGGNAYAIVGQA